jgi:hypothetical protein
MTWKNFSDDFGLVFPVVNFSNCKPHKLHNQELRDLYSSPGIIRMIKLRRMRWVGHVARMEEKRNMYRLLVGKPEGKRPLGRPIRWDCSWKGGMG